MNDLRREALEVWVVQHLRERKISTESDYLFVPLSGDASFRRYFRVKYTESGVNKSLLAVDAPVEQEDSHAFVEIDQLLVTMGAIVPEIVSVDYDRGFLIVSDFGDRLYSQLSGEAYSDKLNLSAIDTLLMLQNSTVDIGILPNYSGELLRQELALFSEWFIQVLLGLELTPYATHLIDNCNTLLVESALQQPQRFVHRDYHSRNLLFVEADQPALIDFQGAAVGAITYDLVSLLKDCYIHWPEKKYRAWLSYYYQQACKTQLLKGVTEAKFQYWFDLMGLQRHLKVLGIFSRLYCRDGKSAYLNDLPLVIMYIRKVIQAYEDFAEFSAWFEGDLMPKIQKTAWYKKL